MSRFGFPAILLGGLAGLLIGVDHLITPDGSAMGDVAYLVRGIAMAAALLAVAALCTRARALAWVGAIMAAVASIAQVALVAAYELGLGDFFESPIMPVSLLLLLVGIILVTIAAIRARALPVWAALALLAGLLLTAVPVVGEITAGLAWLAVAAGMIRRPVPAAV